MFNDDNYKAISVFATEYDSGVSVEYTSSIKSNRSLLKLIVLSILTCGVYALYFCYMCGRDINLIAMNDGRKTANFILVFIFSLLMLGAVGFFPIYYYVSNGGELSFVSNTGFDKIFRFFMLVGLLALMLVPQLIWFHNFSLRVDCELQKRKTPYRLPTVIFWIFACIVPVFFYLCCIAVFILSDMIEAKWIISSVYAFCGVAASVSLIIYFGFVVFTMNALAQCAIYKNVEYR